SSGASKRRKVVVQTVDCDVVHDHAHRRIGWHSVPRSCGVLLVCNARTRCKAARCVPRRPFTCKDGCSGGAKGRCCTGSDCCAESGSCAEGGCCAEGRYQRAQ